LTGSADINAGVTYIAHREARATDQRAETVTALHEAINEKYLRAGISIAFPQRDVHLDASKPLEIKRHRLPKAP